MTSLFETEVNVVYSDKHEWKARLEMMGERPGPKNLGTAQVCTVRTHTRSGAKRRKFERTSGTNVRDLSILGRHLVSCSELLHPLITSTATNHCGRPCASVAPARGDISFSLLRDLLFVLRYVVALVLTSHSRFQPRQTNLL